MQVLGHRPLKILLLGSGELGKELVLSAQRLGIHTIAVDKYANAPAHHVADECFVIDMLDGAALKKLVKRTKPDFIVPEIEAIRTEALRDLEKQGFAVVPSAKAVDLTMNRDKIRNFAREKLGLKTAKYAYADNLLDVQRQAKKIGFPCVIKPIMSSSGKGQTVAKSFADVKNSWKAAMKLKRGDQMRVIVEEFIAFDFEITLLTVRQNNKTYFCAPIGHRQEGGDFQESWQPQKMNPKVLKEAQNMAAKITAKLGGNGLFGVEFFVKGKQVYFSELSPRPHDTGMVTMVTQDLSEFDLHLRAFLGLPIPGINLLCSGASAALLAPAKMSETKQYKILGINRALRAKNSQIRIFGKPLLKPLRRMGLLLVSGDSTKTALKQVKSLRKMVKFRNW